MVSFFSTNPSQNEHNKNNMIVEKEEYMERNGKTEILKRKKIPQNQKAQIFPKKQLLTMFSSYVRPFEITASDEQICQVFLRKFLIIWNDQFCIAFTCTCVQKNFVHQKEVFEQNNGYGLWLRFEPSRCFLKGKMRRNTNIHSYMNTSGSRS